MPEKPAAYDPLLSVLAKLVPEGGRVEVTTVDGRKLSLNTALPARRQVVVARAMERLLRRSVVAGTVSGTGDVFGQLVASINDDETFVDLAATFLAAYPDALPDGADPLDVLAIEEVVAAIVPLIAGPAIRLLGLAGPLGSAQGLGTQGK